MEAIDTLTGFGAPTSMLSQGPRKDAFGVEGVIIVFLHGF
jgi:hypothetical protein